MGSRASGVGSDFVFDDGTRKNTGDGGWCHAVGPTTCEAGFLLFTKSVEKPVGVLSGKRFRGCCFCSRKIEQKIVYLGEVFARVSLYIYYRQQLRSVLFWLSPVVARL